MSKGFLQEPLMYVISALTLAIVVVFMTIVVNQFNGGIQDLNSTMVTNTTKTLSSDYNTSMNGLDIGFAILVFGFFIGSIILARYVDEIKPLWIFLGLIGMFVLGFIGMIFENIYTAFNDNATFAGVTANMPFLNFFLNNFVITLIVYVAVITIALLTRGGGSEI